MATVVNTLYPPIVSTFQNAFVNPEDAVVYFTLSSFNSASDIKHVHVSCVNQLNNENALNKSSGIIIEDLMYDKDSGMYYITVPTAYLDGNKFNINQFYKVQIRFDSYDGADVPINEEIKKNEYLLSHTQYFSEWSSVCLIRPISKFDIYLSVFENYTGNSYISFNKSTIQFSGGIVFDDNTETETLESFKFEILDAEENSLYSSSTIYTGENLNPNNIVYSIDLSTLQNGSDGTATSPTTDHYVLRVYARTKNQYQSSKDYNFQISEYSGDDTWQPTIHAELDNETASVTISVKNEVSFVSGILVYVKRASSKDNFKEWQTIYSKKLQTIDFSFKDNTVTSLVWYRYRVEALTNSGTAVAKPKMSEIVLPQFYDAYISRGNKQYAVRYNYKVSSLKPVVNRAKIDTLGGKYPKFTENAVLDYKQFSIQGMISAEADVYNEFTDKSKEIYHANNTLKDLYSEYKDDFSVKDLVRNDFAKFEKIDGNQYPNAPISSVTSQRFLTTTTNDWLYEREFREALTAWLNDGEPKLYRSMAEGSMVVMLTDISLTPNETVGRRLWDFTATVYEIENSDSLDTLESLGIYNRTRIDSIFGSGKIDSGEDTKDYIEVLQPGQVYKMTVTDTNDIRNKILDNLTKRYSGVLGGSKAYDIVLKNVKIFFHNKPNAYVFSDSSGKDSPMYISAVSADGVTPNPAYYDYLKKGKIHQGYSFNIITSASAGEQTFFVNDRGYYQIPSKLDVKSLSFNHIGDVVTIEYTLCYKQTDAYKENASGTQIDRTLVGQESGIFKPNQHLGEKIRRKYNFIKMNGDVTLFTQQMKYWKGICLDVTPMSIVNIKYHDHSTYESFLVGETGVLHLLKDVPIDDIYFVGLRMKQVNKDKYLQPNEFRLDPSVNLIKTDSLSWFTVVDNVDTHKKVTIQQDNQNPVDTFSTSWKGVNSSQTTRRPYDNIQDVKKPVLNTVYNIMDELKLYYNYQWYDFNFGVIDNIDNNYATAPIGIAAMPVEGMINYYGTVMTINYQ